MRAHTNVRQGSPLILFSSKVSNDSTSTALIGQIAALTKSESGNQSPLSKEMKVSTHRTSDPELDRLGGEYITLFDDGGSQQPTSNQMPWPTILRTLKAKGIDSVMIEGGATVINTLLMMPELVDVCIVTIAPTWLGSGGVNVAPQPHSTVVST